jgi:hypothetical protein
MSWQAERGSTASWNIDSRFVGWPAFIPGAMRPPSEFFGGLTFWSLAGLMIRLQVPPLSSAAPLSPEAVFLSLSGNQ